MVKKLDKKFVRNHLRFSIEGGVTKKTLYEGYENQLPTIKVKGKKLKPDHHPEEYLIWEVVNNTPNAALIRLEPEKNALLFSNGLRYYEEEIASAKSALIAAKADKLVGADTSYDYLIKVNGQAIDPQVQITKPGGLIAGGGAIGPALLGAIGGVAVGVVSATLLFARNPELLEGLARSLNL